MKIHDLKCDQVPFFAVYEERKKAEFRRNDRNFNVGDHIVLQEFDGKKCTGRELMLEITHIQDGYGIPFGYVILSIKVKW
jgi:hypothetical protein